MKLQTIIRILILLLIFNTLIIAQQQYKDTCYISTFYSEPMDTSSFSTNSFIIVNLDSMQNVPIYKVAFKWSIQRNGVMQDVNRDLLFDSIMVQAGRHYGYCHYKIYVLNVKTKRGNPIVMDSVHNSWIYFVDSPLPVELISFSGRQVGKIINLKWRTETEINNYGFEIERKFTFTNWEKVGFVQGNGNSNSPKNYTFIDSIKTDKKEAVMYRLKQIDNDGKYKYHTSILINLIPAYHESEISVFPNPFKSNVTINYSTTSTTEAYIKVYTILGELVKELLLENTAGTIEMSFSNEASGMYIFTLQSENFLIVKKGILLK